MAIKGYRPDIDGLRAIAILPVVLFHAGFSHFSGGFVGVDIFFVISGYLITSLIIQELDQKQFRFFNFWLKRARRILPALTCMVFFSLIAGWFLFLPDDFKSLGRSAVALSVFASNIYFWLKTGYFTAPADTKPLLHTWTLAVEEQFYLLFPFVLYITMRFARRFCTQIIFFLALLSLGLTFIVVRNHQLAAFFLLPTRAWELFIGSFIALYFSPEKYPTLPWVNELISFIGLSAIGYAIFFYDQNTPLPKAALMPCLGAAVIIVANQNQLTFIGRLLSLPLLVGTGLISYSLYLWHWPLLVFAKYISTSPLTLLQITTILMVSVFIAWGSYSWIETPIRKKRLLSQSRMLVTISALTASMIAIMGLIINFKEGMPDRLNSKMLAAYQEASYVHNPTCQTIKVSKNVAVCANTTTENPDLILWGDSHAEMLLPLLEKLVKQYHLTFWYYACVPVLDVYSVSEHASLSSSSCFVANHELIKLIEQKHIKNIILASFWSQFTEGKEIPMEGAGQREPFYADAKIKSSTAAEAKKVFERHFIATVKKLDEAGANIWIMEQVPSHLYWISNQLVKFLKYGGDVNRIGRPLSEYLKRQAFVNSVFDQLQSEKVHRLKPASILCDKSQFCHGTQNGHSLYRDYNHLSNYGAMKLTPLFTPVFVTISKRTKLIKRLD